MEISVRAGGYDADRPRDPIVPCLSTDCVSLLLLFDCFAWASFLLAGLLPRGSACAWPRKHVVFKPRGGRWICQIACFCSRLLVLCMLIQDYASSDELRKELQHQALLR
ncbi:unnamed protein product [Symbiodinium natans]|uniref:Uncharacterized protein n=1 Tax=Symbiodinium natans TaxID=878477 RepID=A0A812PGG6_9DINO|nr:unnamed protein product [Symbiodinium natans]